METWVVVLIVVVVVVVALAVAVGVRRSRSRQASASLGLPPLGAVSGEEPVVRPETSEEDAAVDQPRRR